MSASTDNPVRGENPVNHGMAVLLEVEALLTDRDRDHHGRAAPVHHGAGRRGLTLPTAPPVRLRGQSGGRDLRRFGAASGWLLATPCLLRSRRDCLSDPAARSRTVLARLMILR
jgi:hypothetical protein